MIVTVGALAMAAEDGLAQAEQERSVSVGVGAGVGLEMPDASATCFGAFNNCNAEQRWPPVLHLLVPVRIPLASGPSLRLTPTGVFGIGQDRISWMVPTSSTEMQRQMEPDPQRAFFGSLGVVAGPEVQLPVQGPVVPYFAGGLGLVLAGTFHSGLQRPDLFDPESYDVEKLDPELHPNTVSPYALQPALAGDLAVGVTAGPVWFELGYQLQALGSARLRRSPRDIEARREPFAWNSLRLTVGIAP